MRIEVLSNEFSICKLERSAPLPEGFVFLAHTDREISLVCETRKLTYEPAIREDNWRCFRVAGELDFSLIGILARITALLADADISVFCVSTYDTDYVMVKAYRLEEALNTLNNNGYTIVYI